LVTSLACLYQALLSRHRGRGVKEVRERKVENDAKMGGRLRVRSCAEVERFEACSDMQGGGEGMGRGSRGLTRILLAVWSQWPDTSKFDSKKRGQRKQVRPKAKRDSVNCRHCSVNCRPKREFEHTHTHTLSLSLSRTHTCHYAGLQGRRRQREGPAEARHVPLPMLPAEVALPVAFESVKGVAWLRVCVRESK